MRVLIVDDMRYKQEQVIYALKEKGITDYEIAESVRDALFLLKQNKFDIMITDLGLPRFKGGFVENSLEGLNMLTELYFRDMTIPTIVFSTTNIPSDNLLDLTDVFEYPYIGRAIDIETLELLLQIFMENDKTSKPKIKSLIIDDIVSFKEEVQKVLKSLDIEDYDIVDNQDDAIRKIAKEKYDLLILGMLFRVFSGAKMARPTQGKDLLFILGKNESLIPAVVYSEAFFEWDILDVKEIGYPLIGQASKPEELKALLEDHLNNNESLKVYRERKKKNSEENSN